MSREYKFRVYIPEFGKLVYFDLNDFDYSHRYLDSPEHPVQQYTGIKDKSGKLIYEGDIVSFLYEASEHEVEREIGEVTFSEGIFYFGKSLFASNDVNFSVDSIEIIGNIYTKPCTPDPNGECLHCDEPIDTCAFKSVPSNKF
jgi:uncharacterized phage protein (TIGR01671 family)